MRKVGKADKMSWVCKECGHTQAKWTGSCSMCKEWNTFHEEKLIDESSGKQNFLIQAKARAKPVLISEVKGSDQTRFKTGFDEIDRLAGGGMVKGSLNLIGGEPGIGKSTLLLQLSKKLADQGLTVLYVCGEESVEQTSLRAKRLGIDSPRLYLLSETLFTPIVEHIKEIKPDVLIVDSIQIVYKSEIPSLPGSVTQVREIAFECMRLSKGWHITTFLVGHVTKSGELAGPRVLEHMVDTVFEFEGDKKQGYRLLRSVKNRFGSTDDLALLSMTEGGLVEVPNASSAFLQERQQNAIGSAIVATLRGSRATLIEIQALVAKSSFATATRRCSGIDPKRLSLLLAVLEKRMGYPFFNLDVFVSSVGGMKINEPAADFAILLAIASSFVNKPLQSNCLFLGEVGLGGEIRSAHRIESRLKEAVNMGFTKCLLSKKQLNNLPKTWSDKIELIGVSNVADVIEKYLK